MLYREIMAVCSQIHTKHTNTVCGQNVELLHVKLAVRIVISQFIFGIKHYMFRTVPLSIVRSFSLYTQQWYMSYRFADSLRPVSIVRRFSL